MSFSNNQKMDIYEAAERHFPKHAAVSASWRGSLSLFEVIMEPRAGGRDLRAMFATDGTFAGFAGKTRLRALSARDPQKPGWKNKARRKPINAAMSDIKRAGARNLIGRRKTVKTKAGRLISRKSQRAAKRAMFRMGQKAKLLACHACSRNDFATEKSLKRHTEKFHTPGQKSPRGFRTRRDPGRPDPSEMSTQAIERELDGMRGQNSQRARELQSELRIRVENVRRRRSPRAFS